MLELTSKRIGLTIEHSGIHYIKLKNGKSGDIERKGYLPLGPGIIVENQIVDAEAFRLIMKEWVQQEKLKGQSVFLSIPPSQIIIRRMTIPSANRKQVEQLVGLEVETTLHLPFENPVFDYIEIASDEDSTTLLVFAAPRKLIESYTEILDSCGVKVKSVEISATALARLLTRHVKESLMETMVIHMNRGLLDLYLFHDGHPVFLRTIDLQDQTIGRLMAEPSMQDADSLSAEQMVEITAEISRMLSFFQYSLNEGAQRINEIIITGMEENRGLLLKELRQALPELAIREIGFQTYPEGSHVENRELNDYRIALGAALREQGDDSIDLMYREDREKVIFPYIAAGLLVVWLGASVATGLLYMQNANEAKELERRIGAAEDIGKVLQTELASLSTDSGKESSPEQVIETVMAVKMNPVEVWDALDQALPEKAVIRDISYNHRSDGSLTIDFDSMEDASAYLVKLRDMPLIIHAAVQTIAHTSENSDYGNASLLPVKVFKVKFSILFGEKPDQSDPQASTSTEGGQEDGPAE